MNTLTQQQINQHQWQVADGVARIVNPNKKPTERDFYKRHSEGLNWGDYLNKEHAEFEQFAKQHAYFTNAPDGIYSGEAFEVGEQILIEGYTEWFEILAGEDLTEAMQRIIGTDSYRCETRQFLRLKPSHLPAVLTTRPGEEWKDRYKEVWYQSFNKGEFRKASIPLAQRHDSFESFLESLGTAFKGKREWHLNTPPTEQEAETVERIIDKLQLKYDENGAGCSSVIKLQRIEQHVDTALGIWRDKTNQLQSTLTQKDQLIAELEQMLDQCQKNDLYFEQEKEQLNNRIAELERGREWISAGDRLPEGQTEVLVYMPKYGSDMNVYFLTDLDPKRKTWFNCFFDTKPFSDVTHWQPLPTPPQH